MEITEEGKSVLNRLNEYFNIYTDDNQLAIKLSQLLVLKKFMLYLVMQMLKRMLNPKWEDKANYWKASYMKTLLFQ